MALVNAAKQYGRNLAQRLALSPLRLLPAKSRAVAVGALQSEQILTVENCSQSFRFYCPGPLLVWRATSLLTKEIETINWIDEFPRGAVFWDIGANVGTYTIYAGVKRRAQILAFEPFAPNYYILCRNIALNGLAERVRAYCLAVCTGDRLGVLNLCSTEMGSALHQFGDLDDASPYASTQQRHSAQGMIGISIDDFLERFQALFPSFIKIDVDGLELEILRGAEKTLRDRRLKSLLIELNMSDGAAYTSALTLMREAGFELELVGKLQGQRIVGANHIFKRPMKGLRCQVPTTVAL